MDDRFTIANMAIEAGAKNGIFPVDDKTLEYINGRVSRSYTVYEADPDAEYVRKVTIDWTPWSPPYPCPTCPATPGPSPRWRAWRFSRPSSLLHQRPYLRPAGRRCLLKGRKVAPGVRCIVIPATQAIYLQAMRRAS